MKFDFLGFSFSLNKTAIPTRILVTTRSQLSLDEMRAVVYRTNGCNHGSCSKCSIDSCHIKQYRTLLLSLKPSFCQGNPDKCKRTQVQTCHDCRMEHLHLNIKSDFTSEIRPVNSKDKEMAALGKNKAILEQHGLLKPKTDYVEQLAKLYCPS